MIAAVAPNWRTTGSMTQARIFHTATLLPDGRVLVVGGSGGDSLLDSAEVYDPATGTWSPTDPLTQARVGHTATLLPGGKVLVVGGLGSGSSNNSLDSAEVYDPATGIWSPTAPLAKARVRHTATLLPGGKVLVVGGLGRDALLDSAEVYDPATGTWSPTAPLTQARLDHTATLLPGGKVLVVGGAGGSDPDTLDSAEVYDPATGTWSPTAPLTQARVRHTATLLPGGKVLVVGGSVGEGGGSLLDSAEVYDPATGTWSPTAPLTQACSHHTATLLPGGKVLVVGGYRAQHGSDTSLDSAEVYDPATGTWSPTAPLTQARAIHTATLLPGGKVLVVGGLGGVGQYGSGSSLDSAEVYDPATGTWSPTAPLTRTRTHYTATLLPGGKVLVVGGDGGGGGYGSDTSLDSAEVYDPATGTWSSTAPLTRARTHHTATLLHGGKVLVVGGYSGMSFSYFASAELYDPATGTWSSTAPLTRARSDHTATLLPGGKVLVVGGSVGQYGSESPLDSAEVYDPATGTWSSTAPLARARTHHTATLLPGGKVLVVGGESGVDRYGGNSYFDSAEVYDPATGTWSPTAPLTRARTHHTATLLPGGKVLVVGGYSGNSYFDSAEVYDPATNTWSLTAPLTQARSDHTATLLPGGKVLVVGGSYRNSAEVYDPATGTWSSTAPLAQVRLRHTATLLPGGKVLVVGGDNLSSSTELYADSDGDDAWSPRITHVSHTSLETGTPLTVTGERFLGPSEGSSGNSQSSPANFPLLSLSSVENSLWVPLLGHDFSDTSVTATVPPLPNGYYLLNVTTQGLTSSWTISINDTTPPVPPSLETPTPNQRFFTSKPEFSGTAEPGSTVRVFVDDVQAGTVQAGDNGGWVLTLSPLTWGPHNARVTATDMADNTSDPSPVAFSTVQRGYYGCAAGPSAWMPWPCALLALGLLRRRRPH